MGGRALAIAADVLTLAGEGAAAVVLAACDVVTGVVTSAIARAGDTREPPTLRLVRSSPAAPERRLPERRHG